jgi:ABC-type nitrate/sulfonate/bicarbonate transport system substrate-binding protein
LASAEDAATKNAKSGPVAPDGSTPVGNFGNRHARRSRSHGERDMQYGPQAALIAEAFTQTRSLFILMSRSATTRAPSSWCRTSDSAKVCRNNEDISGKTVAIDALGSISHYQLEQIARVKKVDMNRVTVKPMQTLDAIVRAIATNEVDAAIMPASYARDLLASNQAKLVGWYSELDEIQFGALFASSKMLATRRAAIEKVIRAYRRGVADYTEALLRKDRNSKRTADIKSHEAATTIARYVYPDHGTSAAVAVEASAYFIDPQAQLDVADIDRQIAWHKAQGRVDKTVSARDVVDPSFVK